MKRSLEQVPIHVLWLVILPILLLVANNLGQVRPTIGLRAIALGVASALIVLLVLRLIVGDWVRAGLLTSLGLLLFFAYGHVYNALRMVQIAGLALGRHRYLLPVWLLVGVGGVWLISRSDTARGGFTLALNLGLGLVLLMPIAQIVAFRSRAKPVAAAEIPISVDDRRLPDIYFLVLDAYTSEDVLADTFQLDNSPFLDQLRRMGFYVADCSMANYAQTELSLAATLNMAYLDELIDESDDDRSQLWPLLRHSAIRLLLEDLGYRTVAFETGYYWSEWEDADEYLAPRNGFFSGMSAFEATLLRTTAAWAVIDAMPKLPGILVRDVDRSADAHRDRLLYVFDQLEKIPDEAGPKFVFAHIVSPHRPVVFDSEGNPIGDNYDWSRSQLGLDQYAEGYREQVLYVNARMKQIIEQIIEDSAVPPIIVIQGDHGPEEGSAEDRMSILSAFYMGQQARAFSYRSYTPVNTFKTVLAEAFGTELPHLEDVSYFSAYSQPFEFTRIPNRCASE